MRVIPDPTMLVHMAEAVRDGKLSIPVAEKFHQSPPSKEIVFFNAGLTYRF